MKSPGLLENNIFKLATLASFLAHVVVFVSASRLLPSLSPKSNEPSTVKVRIQPPNPPTTQPPTAPKPPAPPPPRQRVRVDKRLPPPPIPQKPPEVRAGLSDSLAKPGTARELAPAIAVGNSSLAEVNPEDANKPPPDPLFVGEEEPVAEVAADTPAQCPLPPSLELTSDALNAGLTNAEVVIEVAIASSGMIQDAILKTGTGYEIDKIAIKAAMKLKCSPAVIGGRAVAITGKKLVWKVIYD